MTPDYGRRFWPCEELVRAVARRERVAPLGRVLEAGCGNGANLWFLAEHAARVIGLDASTAALAEAAVYMLRRNPPAQVDFQPGDVTAALPFPNGSFDSVVDCMASQHVPWAAHAAVYREYRRVLRPGGWLFLYHLDAATTTGAPLGTWALAEPDYAAIRLFPAAGLTCLPPRDHLTQAAAEAGFLYGNVNGLVRQYDNGDEASYTVLDAEAA